MLIEVNYNNYKEVNKKLKCNHLDLGKSGYLNLINNRTHKVIGIIPFPDVYDLRDLDLQ